MRSGATATYWLHVHLQAKDPAADVLKQLGVRRPSPGDVVHRLSAAYNVPGRTFTVAQQRLHLKYISGYKQDLTEEHLTMLRSFPLYIAPAPATAAAAGTHAECAAGATVTAVSKPQAAPASTVRMPLAPEWQNVQKELQAAGLQVVHNEVCGCCTAGSGCRRCRQSP